MKTVYILAMLMLIVLILIALIPLGNVTLVMALPTRGPKTDTDIRFYPNSSAGYAALKANDIDFLQSPLTYEQKLDAEADPNLCIAAYHENGMIEFDLNNNYTVSGIYPGIRNPLTVTEFRQGLTCAVDKQYIVDEILLGAGGILNVPIPLNSITWWNETLLQANYEFK
ncbi:MAG: ABC transporter substrate-binding protein, partial [Candidatus Bathyarchaeota archaeon]|nr:ABC transporter substrate-binding protein [Candidatus Bathyarchaeota archaeon]